MSLKDIFPLKQNERLPSFDNFQHEINDLFNRFFTHRDLSPLPLSAYKFPFLNVSETKKEIIIKAELPGMERDDISIEVSKNLLTIKGERNIDQDDKHGNYYIREISSGNFFRSVSLPFELNDSKIDASFEKGILIITIQKPEGYVAQSRTIPIK